MTEKELEEVLDPYLMTEVGEERKEDEVRRKAC
jgi:aspartate ammonia-lyase